jgi:hypothetical protein
MNKNNWIGIMLNNFKTKTNKINKTVKKKNKFKFKTNNLKI